MRNRCEAFEQAIWDHVRFGTDLPADARAHIDRCADCARALTEAGQIASAVIQADCVPPAPDCRSAVMARITPRQRQPRFAWAYACAAVAIASIAIGSIMSLSPGSRPGARKMAKTLEAAKPNLIAPAPKREAHSYFNTGERDNRYNPEPRLPGRPAIPEPVMVARVVTGPSAGIPAPEITTSIVGDNKDSYAAGSAAAPAAEEVRPAPAGMPASSTDVVTESFATPTYSSDGSLRFANTAGGDLLRGFYADAATRPSSPMSLSGELNDNIIDSFNFKADKAKSVRDFAEVATMDGYDKFDGSLCFGSLALKEKSAVAEVIDRSSAEARMMSANLDALAIADDSRPVAMVVASWTPPEPRPVSYGYYYTDVDAVTGRTTTVSVKRSGNHVEVHLEGSEPPVKGSVDHATIPSV